MNEYEHQAIKKRVTKTYNLNDLVVFSTLVSGKVVLEAVSVGGNIATLGGLQVVGHVRIVGEGGSGGTNLGTHVANGGHTSARETRHRGRSIRQWRRFHP